MAHIEHTHAMSDQPLTIFDITWRGENYSVGGGALKDVMHFEGGTAVACFSFNLSM
jgi:hypothetical protein